MTKPRIKVKETTEIDASNFTGKLEHIISQFQDWMNEGEWEGIEECCEPYEEVSYNLYKHREETDKEYEKRMRQLEKEKAEKAKAKERKLAQLKKDLASLSDDDKKLLGL